MFTSITRRVSMLAIFGLLPAALVFGQVSVKQVQLEKEGTELISHLEDVGRNIQYEAGQLEAMSRNGHVSKSTHYHHLQKISEQVNNGLRPTLARLTEIQPELPSWKQDAIDQMLASAKALAVDTNSAILNKNDAGTKPVVLNSEDRELMARINDHAQVLVNTSDAAERLASAHLKASEARLEVSQR